MVHTDALCWNRAILTAQFRYAHLSESVYWNTQGRWERRTLSALGRFVPFHLLCCYNLRQKARDRLLIRILAKYACIESFRGFLSEQDPVFAYKASEFI